jgi:hypothetical protein
MKRCLEVCSLSPKAAAPLDELDADASATDGEEEVSVTCILKCEAVRKPRVKAIERSVTNTRGVERRDKNGFEEEEESGNPDGNFSHREIQEESCCGERCSTLLPCVNECTDA